MDVFILFNSEKLRRGEYLIPSLLHAFHPNVKNKNKNNNMCFEHISIPSFDPRDCPLSLSLDRSIAVLSNNAIKTHLFIPI
eukprot:gene2197-1364_t